MKRTYLMLLAAAGLLGTALILTLPFLLGRPTNIPSDPSADVVEKCSGGKKTELNSDVYVGIRRLLANAHAGTHVDYETIGAIFNNKSASQNAGIYNAYLGCLESQTILGLEAKGVYVDTPRSQSPTDMIATHGNNSPVTDSSQAQVSVSGNGNIVKTGSYVKPARQRVSSTVKVSKPLRAAASAVMTQARRSRGASVTSLPTPWS